MRKTFIAFFVLLVIAGAAYWFYTGQKQKKTDPWEFIPENAVLAYENTGTVDAWNKFVERKVWDSLKKIPYFNNWESGLTQADSLTGKSGALDKLFRNRKLIVSLHITSSDSFDFLFCLDIQDQAGREMLETMLSGLRDDNGLNARSRNYQGYEIRELVNQKDNTTFTYLIYQNIVAGSFTPFLVEDVVRNIENKFQQSLLSKISNLSDIPKLENDEGNIYIDYNKVPDLLNAFGHQQTTEKWHMLKNFTGNTYLDLKIVDNAILMNGITIPDLKSDRNFLSTFRNQNPGRVHVTQYIPNLTAVFYHITFSDFRAWQTQLTKYWSSANPDQLKRLLDFSEKYDLKFDWVGGEAANAIIETPNKQTPDQLVFIGINDKNILFDELNGFALKLSEEQGDSVYMEIYNEKPIVQLPFAEFPSLVFGDFFTGFENSYFTVYEDYLVMGNSMRTIKYFLNSMEDETNWGKSVRQTVFLENTLSEASFSMMVNTALVWNPLMAGLNEKWQKIFADFEMPLKSLDLMALQVSNLDEKFYTSITIDHREKPVNAPVSSRLQTELSVYTITPIVTRPFIVKNHNNNRMEVLVQDSANILYQISNEGMILWGDSLKARIIGDIHQIDYFRNGKLQYLFATQNALHLLDRNGDYVEGFPVKMKQGVQIAYLSVVDYDNSRNYRLMVADKSGDIWLFDKTGKTLEGWSPRKLDGPLAIPGFHIRVKGGDCMIAMQAGGILNVMNRRGAMYPGFPVDLKVAETSEVFVDYGNDFNTTRLVTISGEGELIEVNLKGKILKREQLYKPARESRFGLVRDALNKTYIIVRQEYNKISFLNNKSELIFESDLFSTGKFAVQYYNFGSDKQLFVALDEEQEFAYIYNQAGERISFEPLECSYPVALLYSSKNNEFLLYKCFNKNMTLSKFN